ncbi:hypothetical protein B0H13DRAFT_2345313 [Mycena leptocephala]|nr:hypothetical protein B0H13DRAFT_2345313 [Mycena leptocephala]
MSTRSGGCKRPAYDFCSTTRGSGIAHRDANPATAVCCIGHGNGNGNGNHAKRRMHHRLHLTHAENSTFTVVADAASAAAGCVDVDTFSLPSPSFTAMREASRRRASGGTPYPSRPARVLLWCIPSRPTVAHAKRTPSVEHHPVSATINVAMRPMVATIAIKAPLLGGLASFILQCSANPQRTLHVNAWQHSTRIHDADVLSDAPAAICEHGDILVRTFHVIPVLQRRRALGQHPMRVDLLIQRAHGARGITARSHLPPKDSPQLWNLDTGDPARNFDKGAIQHEFLHCAVRVACPGPFSSIAAGPTPSADKAEPH